MTTLNFATLPLFDFEQVFACWVSNAGVVLKTKKVQGSKFTWLATSNTYKQNTSDQKNHMNQSITWITWILSASFVFCCLACSAYCFGSSGQTSAIAQTSLFYFLHELKIYEVLQNNILDNYQLISRVLVASCFLHPQLSRKPTNTSLSITKKWVVLGWTNFIEYLAKHFNLQMWKLSSFF